MLFQLILMLSWKPPILWYQEDMKHLYYVSYLPDVGQCFICFHFVWHGSSNPSKTIYLAEQLGATCKLDLSALNLWLCLFNCDSCSRRAQIDQALTFAQCVLHFAHYSMHNMLCLQFNEVVHHQPKFIFNTSAKIYFQYLSKFQKWALL